MVNPPLRSVNSKLECGATKPHAKMPCSSKISVSCRAKTENPIKTAPGLNQLCDSVSVFLASFAKNSSLNYSRFDVIVTFKAPSPLCTEVTITTWELEPSRLKCATAARRRYSNWIVNKWEVFPGLRASCWWITLHTKDISDIHHATSLCKTKHL